MSGRKIVKANGNYFTYSPCSSNIYYSDYDTGLKRSSSKAWCADDDGEVCNLNRKLVEGIWFL